MTKLFLAAATAFALMAFPALAQGTDCPEGTATSNPDGSPVTCDNDDNTNDTTQMQDDSSAGPANADQGESVLDSTQAGEGVKDSLTGDGKQGGGNN